MLLNCKQCGKNINEWFLQYTVCTDSKVSGKESIFFPFCRKIDAQDDPKLLLNAD